MIQKLTKTLGLAVAALCVISTLAVARGDDLHESGRERLHHGERR